MPAIRIREATAADAALILRFIRELAEYERAPHAVVATAADLEKALFGPDARAHALVCSIGDEDVGCAVYFFNFSTWLGKYGLYLEDLYISPAHRGRGAGETLLRHLARLALERDCGRLEWNVLDWNEAAIRFYESFGAKPLSEWVGYRLDGEALRDFAGD